MSSGDRARSSLNLLCIGAIQQCHRFYNEARPHSALNWKTPKKFALSQRAEATLQDNQEPENPT